MLHTTPSTHTRPTRSLFTLAAAGALAIFGAAGAASAQPDDISWHTIDGGGGTSTEAGMMPHTGLSISGTIGQPDVGLLTQGAFALAGGFWTDSPSELCFADFNADGELNPDDLSDFINCFFDGACPAADFDGDGQQNADDLSDYINSFFNGCP